MTTLAATSAVSVRSAEYSAADYGVALLRAALGVMFLAHGALKVLVFTLPGTAAFFASVGFPGFIYFSLNLATPLLDAWSRRLQARVPVDGAG